jgi:hypothetical protein
MNLYRFVERQLFSITVITHVVTFDARFSHLPHSFSRLFSAVLGGGYYLLLSFFITARALLFSMSFRWTFPFVLYYVFSFRSSFGIFLSFCTVFFSFLSFVFMGFPLHVFSLYGHFHT